MNLIKNALSPGEKNSRLELKHPKTSFFPLKQRAFRHLHVITPGRLLPVLLVSRNNLLLHNEQQQTDALCQIVMTICKNKKQNTKYQSFL